MKCIDCAVLGNIAVKSVNENEWLQGRADLNAFKWKSVLFLIAWASTCLEKLKHYCDVL